MSTHEHEDTDSTPGHQMRPARTGSKKPRFQRFVNEEAAELATEPVALHRLSSQDFIVSCLALAFIASASPVLGTALYRVRVLLLAACVLSRAELVVALSSDPCPVVRTGLWPCLRSFPSPGNPALPGRAGPPAPRMSGSRRVYGFFRVRLER